MKLEYIQPGKSVQTAFIESLNESFRDECLNQHSFTLRIPMKWRPQSEGSGASVPEEVAHPFRAKWLGHRSEATLAA